MATYKYTLIKETTVWFSNFLLFWDIERYKETTIKWQIRDVDATMQEVEDYLYSQHKGIVSLSITI